MSGHGISEFDVFNLLQTLTHLQYTFEKSLFILENSERMAPGILSCNIRYYMYIYMAEIINYIYVTTSST